MKNCYLILIMSALGLSSCSTAKLDDYVHEPTNDIRNKLISQRARVKPVSKLTEDPVLLVPNLREFTTSFTVQCVKLIICSDAKDRILISDITLVNDDTGYEFKDSLNKEVTLQHRGHKESGPYQTWIYLIKGNDIDYKNFKGATGLTLSVTYKFLSNTTSPDAERKTYKLRLKTVTGTAWAT